MKISDEKLIEKLKDAQELLRQAREKYAKEPSATRQTEVTIRQGQVKSIATFLARRAK